MSVIVQAIERFLLDGLAANDGTIEIQRSELALRFGCAPSQINYCLATRFSLERGYLVESRRGGGGYIRITELNTLGRESYEQVLLQSQMPLSQTSAEHMIAFLSRAGLITNREASMMLATMDRQTLLLEANARDALRARLLRAMLGAILTKEE